MAFGRDEKQKRLMMAQKVQKLSDENVSVSQNIAFKGILVTGKKGARLQRTITN